MVEGSEDPDERGTIGGNITNALTGRGVSGATLTIRKGWNKTTGAVVDTIQTNTSGGYQVTLPLGNYTILIERDGYISNHINAAVTRNGNLNVHGTLIPDGDEPTDDDIVVGTGDLRVVLTWGATPYDLDSHLFGPTVDGDGTFHVYYASQNYWERELVANLDLDDVTSYGPETTTIYDMNEEGTYSFYVHDYTNRGSYSSNIMSNSGATIKVYSGNTLCAVFYVPANVGGTVWHVFDFDATTGVITPINNMYYSSNSGSLSRYALSRGGFTESDAIRMIAESSVEAKNVNSTVEE